jgi:hypothetical protein
MRITLTIICLCTLCMPAFTQNISTADISWHVSKTFDITTGDMTETADTIISRGASQLEWKKTGGSTRLFTVSEVIGQWTNITQAGEITYEVNDDTTQGTVTFVKAESTTIIRLMMTGEAPFFYELIISGYQVQ